MRQRGFTLIELSIVLVILGLIVGGIVGGKALIRQGEIHKIITTADNYKVAYNAFHMQYDALPGDFTDASQYWPGSHNGDGDGVIGAEGGHVESLYVWEHFGEAELIPGTYAGCCLHQPWEPGVNMPNVKVGTTLSLYITSAEHVYDKGPYPIVEISGYSGPAQSQDAGILKPSEARSIDLKIDDGKADTGNMTAYDGFNSDGNCTTDTGSFFTGSGDYILGTATPDCALIFAINK